MKKPCGEGDGESVQSRGGKELKNRFLLATNMVDEMEPKGTGSSTAIARTASCPVTGQLRLSSRTRERKKLSYLIY